MNAPFFSPSDSQSGSFEDPPHVPVLRAEVLQFLSPVAGKVYVDATLGAGGHSEAILQQIKPDGRLWGIDQDPLALQLSQKRLQPYAQQFSVLEGNFSRIAQLLPPEALPITGGVLADIGVSSMQLDQSERGFSFSREAALDMRMSPGGVLTAETIVNTYDEARLVQIFSEYGEEHLSKTLAHEIVQRRAKTAFSTTTELAGFITAIYRERNKHEKIHPATRVFQALRIEVNDELGNLRRFLEALPAVLAPGAIIVVISFHSLEDRIIKQFFQSESRDCICPPRLPICQCGHQASFKILTGKPVQAEASEIKTNPRARSAKLRAAIRR